MRCVRGVPTTSISLHRETMLALLTKTNPEEAERLMQMAQETVTRRWHTYEHLAKQEPTEFEQVV